MAAAKETSPLVAATGAVTPGAPMSPMLEFFAHRGGYVRYAAGFAQTLTDPDAGMTFDVQVNSQSVLREGIVCNVLDENVAGRLIRRPRFERGDRVTMAREGTGSAGVAAGFLQLLVEYDQ